MVFTRFIRNSESARNIPLDVNLPRWTSFLLGCQTQLGNDFVAISSELRGLLATIFCHLQ